ncbi:MAG: hypothetical protein Q8O56_05465 [Solirubrobacteraceae bacterium]|nr:hypothetical protein [Solirubrobacteraceae bacterium]
MNPGDAAPEQRWRRTVDRRNRPAKLKVGRLLRDFGYAAPGDGAFEAIEARLAAVGLALEPSLRTVAADDVITIYARGAAAAPSGAPPPSAAQASDERRSPAPPGAAPAPFGLDSSAAAGSPSDTTGLPGDDAAAAAAISELERELSSAREQGEQLRDELEGRLAEHRESAAVAQQLIAQQGGELAEQRRRLDELGQALSTARQALAETRDEVRRTVDELLADPAGPPDAERDAHGVEPARSAAADEDPPVAHDGYDERRPPASELGSRSEEPRERERSLPPPPPIAVPRAAAKAEPRERPSGRGGKLRGRVARARARGWQGACSVCGRVPDEGERDDLQGAGWDLEGESAACAQCRELGWQLRPGGGAPFRPLSPRRPLP